MRTVCIGPAFRSLSTMDCMNKKTRTLIRKMASDVTQAGLNISIEEFFGKNTLHIDGIPIRLADQISDTEAEVA